MSEKIIKIIELIKELSVPQINELTESLKSYFNIQESFAAKSENDDDKEEKVEEKTANVSVVLTEVGATKVQVYKLISTLVKKFKGSDLNMIAAKALTESEGKIILENIPEKDAEDSIAQLKSVGATAQIKK